MTTEELEEAIERLIEEANVQTAEAKADYERNVLDAKYGAVERRTCRGCALEQELEELREAYDALILRIQKDLDESIAALQAEEGAGTGGEGGEDAPVGQLIMWATDLQPFLMGMFVSVLVGVALTLPISSAAICAALGLTGLAGGAAVAGCCAQMVGFAVISFRENRWGGLVAQGLGTSMLQVPNIIKNPRIWIAPTLASAITGPLATCVFRLEMNGAPVSSGMGTCGLVGQIGVIDGWVNDVANGLKAAITPMDWVGLALLCFVLPAVLSWVINLGLRKLGWVKDGDMKLYL